MLKSRKGHLRLWGAAPCLDDEDSVTFLGRRQTEFKCQIESKIDFIPSDENEEAGIAIVMSSRFHYELGIRKAGGSRQAFLRKRVGDIKTETACNISTAEPIILKISAEETKYHFEVGDKDGMQMLGSGLTKLISAELANTWTGAVIGMYATGNGKPSTTPADFDWFDYKDL